MPKSGEHDDQTAPNTEVLRYAITASGIFGKYAATRSPLFIWLSLNHPDIFATLKFRSFQDKIVL